MLHTGRAWGSLPIQPRLNQHNPSSIIQAKAALLIGVGFVVVYDQRVLRERCSMIRTSPTLSIALSLYPSIPLSLYLSLSIYLSLSLSIYLARLPRLRVIVRRCVRDEKLGLLEHGLPAHGGS